MRDRKEKEALRYLKRDQVTNMDMIEPIRLKEADILYADGDGVMIRERRSESYMLATDDAQLGRTLIKTLDQPGLLRVNQKELIPELQDQYAFKEVMSCYQVVYLSKKPVISDHRLTIRALGLDDYDMIRANYENLSDTELTEHVTKGDIYGGYHGRDLIGFIGTHFEGSMGILFILPAYRRMGFASELESFLINYQLAHDRIPYAQVEEDNRSSLALQYKLGLTKSDHLIYWLF